MRFAYLIGLLPCGVLAQQFVPECPKQATLEPVESPARWSDQCFAAVNGRQPDPANVGESSMVYRDIDLDGDAERLEIRGVGNASKQIYIFKETDAGYRYLGRLDAHPSFTVQMDSSGTPTIEYQHRFGADDIQTKRLQYVGGRFVEVESTTP